MSDFYSQHRFKPFIFDSSLNPSHSPDNTDITKPDDILCRYYTLENLHTHEPNVSKCNLSLFHSNTRSLNKRSNDVVNYTSSFHHHFDIYGFSETWFMSDDDADLIDIDNFSVENCIRYGRQGGGVSLFINSDLNYINRPDLSLDCTDCDSLFIEVSNNSSNFIVGIVYKPEYVIYNDFSQQLNRTLHAISSEKKPCYLMGDFNLDLLKHETCPRVSDFINLFYSHDFIPCIDRPTRIKTNKNGHTSISLIDNIFTNNISSRINSGVVITDLSDHFPVFITQANSRPNIAPCVNQSSKSRQLKPSNIKGLVNALSLVDWQIVINTTTEPDEAYNAFISKFSTLYDAHCPIINKNISKRNSPKKPWITKGLIKSLQTKDKLFKFFVANPTPSNKLKYTDYRNHLNLLLRLSKKSFITSKIEDNKNNSKLMWRTLNSLLGRNKQARLPDFFLNKHGNKIYNNAEIAENFNDFFANIGKSLADKIPEPPMDYKPPSCNNSSSLFLSPTTADEIIELTMKFKLSNSSGSDGISNTLLKQIVPSIGEVIAHIFNLSLSSGIVPSQLKIANVTPIFKAGDKHDCSNYRPISILPTLAKLLEKVVYIRIFDFISKHDILTPQQFGFRPKRSTYMAINQLYSNIAEKLDTKQHTVGIFLDLSKAFDTINHSILLNKLYSYGIRGLANDWIRNYLSERSQRVNFNNTLSSPAEISCGVPQGSILGPLLFLLYINDLPLSSKIPHFILFADDTNILFSNPDPIILESLINTELKEISNWFKLNKLSLNIKKTNYMIFKNKHSNKPTINIDIKIDNTPIQQVETTKFLGLLIDSNLSWTSHTQHVCKIVSKYNGIIRKVRPFLPPYSLKTLYNSLILPYLSYGAMIWADPNNSKLNSLFLLQKRVIRSCTNSLWLDHTDPLFLSLSTLKVLDIYKLQLASFMFQFHNNLLPADLLNEDFFYSETPSHQYYTRHAHDLFIKPTNTVLASNTSKSQGPQLWNHLPAQLHNSPTLSSFKSGMKKILMSAYNTPASP